MDIGRRMSTSTAGNVLRHVHAHIHLWLTQRPRFATASRFLQTGNTVLKTENLLKDADRMAYMQQTRVTREQDWDHVLTGRARGVTVCFAYHPRQHHHHRDRGSIGR